MTAPTPIPDAPATDPPKPTPAQAPPTPAQEPDWKAEARKWEDRAKENSDAAKRLAEIEDANKSEVEKATAARQKAEAERDAARAEALRFKIASKHGISDEDAELFLTASDEATLTKQAERLTARAGDRQKQGNRVPREGQNQNSGTGDDTKRSFIRSLTGAD